MLELNKIYKDVKIIDYSHEGEGIAKIDNFVVFVPFTKINQSYNIKITKLKKQFAYGKAIDNKINSDCQFFPSCGGCQIRHLSYQEQLTFKTNLVKNAINKQKLNIKIKNTIANDNINHYRNKIIMPVKMEKNRIIKGYYQQNSHNLININHCLLASNLVNDIFNDVIMILNEVGERAYNEDTRTGNVRYIMIRQGFNTNQIMVCFVCYKNTIKLARKVVSYLTKKYKQITSIVINQNNRHNNAVLGFKNFNLYNCNFITEKLRTCQYRIEPNTFFQVNTKQAEVLYDLVKKYLNPQPHDIVLDAYCGVGSIGCFIANLVKQVVGIEINAKSIKLANINAKLNNLDNINFYVGDMGDKQLTKYYQKCNKIIVDPPRAGLDKKLIDVILDNKFEEIVYVSCNPATLARDLQLLAKDYKIEVIQPVDMFSHTYHVECVCKLVLRSHIV